MQIEDQSQLYTSLRGDASLYNENRDLSQNLVKRDKKNIVNAIIFQNNVNLKMKEFSPIGAKSDIPGMYSSLYPSQSRQHSHSHKTHTLFITIIITHQPTHRLTYTG